MHRARAASTHLVAAKEETLALDRHGKADSAVLELREPAKQTGGSEPQHFVFPSCENGHIGPDVAQKSWRSSWRQRTKAVECPSCGNIQRPTKTCSNQECKADIEKVKSPTAGLRFHDLRRHAITELAESQASDQTIMSIAGHVSARMLAHYSHLRMEAKRNALDALAAPHCKGAVVASAQCSEFGG